MQRPRARGDRRRRNHEERPPPARRPGPGRGPPPRAPGGGRHRDHSSRAGPLRTAAGPERGACRPRGSGRRAGALLRVTRTPPMRRALAQKMALGRRVRCSRRMATASSLMSSSMGTRVKPDRNHRRRAVSRLVRGADHHLHPRDGADRWSACRANSSRAAVGARTADRPPRADGAESDAAASGRSARHAGVGRIGPGGRSVVLDWIAPPRAQPNRFRASAPDARSRPAAPCPDRDGC